MKYPKTNLLSFLIGTEAKNFLPAIIQFASKTFGVKTKGKIVLMTFKKPKRTIDSVKKEQIKTDKKIATNYKVKQLINNIYTLG